MNYYEEYKEINDRNTDVLPYYVYELYGDSGLLVPMHWHNEIEILYAKNSGRLILDGQSILFDEGDILFINSRQLHSTYLDFGGLVYHILIDPKIYYVDNSQYLNEKNIYFPTKLVSDKSVYDNLINEMISVETIVKPENEVKVMSMLYRLLYCLQIDGYLVKKDETDNCIQLLYTKKCIDYIQSNILQKIRIEDIAKDIGISRAYMMRIFKTYTGETINSYIINSRLEEARKKLYEDISILNIAYDCGFTDSSHFCRLFKQKYGCSPVSYRKMHT